MSAPAGLPIYENQEGYSDTWDVGGSRFALWSSSAFDPDSYVGTTTTVPLAVQSIPPTYGQLGPSGSAGGGYNPATQAAAANPFNAKLSPLPVTLVCLAIALLGVHFLYFHKKK